MKCTDCGRLLPDGANFCPSCGSRVVIIENVNTITQSRTEYSITGTFTCGILALCISFFFAGPIGFIGIPLGIAAIYTGIKFLKTPLMKKAVLGMAFGLIGLLLGIIYVIQWGIAESTIMKLNAKYEENFSLTLPERGPDEVTMYFSRLDEKPYWANEYHFILEEGEENTLLGQNLGWIPYSENSVAGHFARELGIEVGESFYIDHNPEGLKIPDFENEEKYNYAVVILDIENSKLIIYEIWK